MFGVCANAGAGVGVVIMHLYLYLLPSVSISKLISMCNRYFLSLRYTFGANNRLIFISFSPSLSASLATMTWIILGTTP